MINKKTNYLNMLNAIDLLLEPDHFEMSILANSSALMKEMIKNINWVGFYILKNDVLLLGPFQGKVACTSIRVGYGVCGTSILLKESILVPNVHEFHGHIPCDEGTNSELVIPLFINDTIYGVLDIDSKKLNRFSAIDKRFLEQAAVIISKYIKRCKDTQD